jgi:hypothetical protein
MRIGKLWAALSLVMVTSLGVHSAGAQTDKKAATKTATSDTAKKAATKSVAPAGKPAIAAKSVTTPAGTVKKSRPPKKKSKTAGKTATKPAGASGKCKDGTYTKAATKRGACSSHGGVDEWYKS